MLALHSVFTSGAYCQGINGDKIPPPAQDDSAPQALRSTIVTCAPALAKRKAVAKPIMPPPMMRMLLGFTITGSRVS